MNLRVGGSIAADLDQYNRLTFTLDLNKLLVPTYPVYAKTEDGQDSIDGNGNRVILFGRDPNQGPIQAIFQSFTDAPGGFKEELKEIMLSTGLEYAYDKQFFVRGGVFLEAKTKRRPSVCYSRCRSALQQIRSGPFLPDSFPAT